MKIHLENDRLWEQTRSDCPKCAGLCCTALFFSKTDGFPQDKAAGVPCINLLGDYRCKIHCALEQQKMKGCIGYDCFGAGQQVTQVVYKGKTWRDLPEQAAEIFDVFTVLFQLYQIRYFLTEALLLIPAQNLRNNIQHLLDENTAVGNSSTNDILCFDVDAYRNKANMVLKQVCRLLQINLRKEAGNCPKSFLGKSFKGKDLSCLDFSMKLLIAADFTGCTFDGTVFLGADTRDANFSNADLREAAFLTQGQINSAKGNRNTKIPSHLYYPITWKQANGLQNLALI